MPGIHKADLCVTLAGVSLHISTNTGFLVVRLSCRATIFLLIKITFSCYAHVSNTLSVLLQLGYIVTYPAWLIYTAILRLFKNPHPAITLKDPEVKYALRLIDKEVGAWAVLSMTSPWIL